MSQPVYQPVDTAAIKAKLAGVFLLSMKTGCDSPHQHFNNWHGDLGIPTIRGIDSYRRRKSRSKQSLRVQIKHTHRCGSSELYITVCRCAGRGTSPEATYKD